MNKLVLLMIVCIISACATPLQLRDNEQIRANWELSRMQTKQMMDDAYARARQFEDLEAWGNVKWIEFRPDLGKVNLYMDKGGVIYPVSLYLSEEYWVIGGKQ